MQFSSRFTIAVHILLAVNEFEGQFKTTSFFLGNSVNVNPVIIRKTLGQLKDAGLVTVEAGVGGAALAKEPKKNFIVNTYNTYEYQRISFVHRAVNLLCRARFLSRNVQRTPACHAVKPACA